MKLKLLKSLKFDDPDVKVCDLHMSDPHITGIYHDCVKIFQLTPNYFMLNQVGVKQCYYACIKELEYCTVLCTLRTSAEEPDLWILDVSTIGSSGQLQLAHTCVYADKPLLIKSDKYSLYMITVKSISPIPPINEQFTTKVLPYHFDGVCAISKNGIVAYPPFKDGRLIMIVYPYGGAKNLNIEDSGRPQMIEFDSEEQILAIANSNGKKINIFDVKTCNILMILRRGYKNPTTIRSLSFSLWSDYLAVSSDRPTVHVFKLGAFNQDTRRVDYKSTISALARFSASLFGRTFMTIKSACRVKVTKRVGAPVLSALGLTYKPTLKLYNFTKNSITIYEGEY